MNSWTLDPRLAADTHPVTSLSLCDVRLMDDTRYPWLVLVPRAAEASDWDDLPRDVQSELATEIDLACRALRQEYQPHKLNVATLGNIVSQMHIHVIARFREDAAWPGPVWGRGEAIRYGHAGLEESTARLARHFP